MWWRNFTSKVESEECTKEHVLLYWEAGFQRHVDVFGRWYTCFSSSSILVPRAHAPFGQHQELRLGWSNTGSPRFTDFPSNVTNLIGWEYQTKTLHMLRNPGQARGRDSWCWPKGAPPLGSRMYLLWVGSPPPPYPYHQYIFQVSLTVAFCAMSILCLQE